MNRTYFGILFSRAWRECQMAYKRMITCFKTSEAEMGLFSWVQYARLYVLVVWSAVSPLPSTDSSGGRVLSRLCVLLRGQQGAAPFRWCVETTGQHLVRRIFTFAFYGGYSRWEWSLLICANHYFFCSRIKASSVNPCMTLRFNSHNTAA